MEPSFDLDINNYTTEDLIKFFKLEDTYSLEDLIQKEYELATEILSIDNKKYNPKYKFDIINFIKSAKEVLQSFYNEMQTIKEINKNVNTFVNKGKDLRVGKIINPLATHQALEKTIIPPESINGYNYETTTSVYLFNSAARNDFFSSEASNSYYDLPIPWSNVIQLTLASVNLPNVMYAFNDDSGTNQIFIEEDSTGLSGIVTLPPGNYVPFSFSNIVTQVLPITEASFPDQLTNAINTTLGSGTRFQVTFDVSSYKMTITNTTNTFSINTIIKEPSDLCSPYSNIISNNSQNTNITDKTNINTITYLQTLGYLMGFRKILYSGASSYTCESIFVNKYSDYIYFSLDDFTGSQTSSNTYGVLGNDILAKNILGVIPLNSSIFTTTFDNNANFIYKKREYFGPVNIKRLNVQLLNQKGNIVNLQGTEFSFAIQVKSIYNNHQKSSYGLRSQGPF
jgi:hypothetical protein